MKKILLSLMAISVMIFGFSAMAQTPDKVSAKENKECCQKSGDMKCKQMQKCDAKKMRKCNPMAAFESLNLTDQQKTQLQEVFNNQNKDNKQKCDSSRREMRKLRLEKIKSILTPEQYVQFLENKVLNAHQGHGPKHQGMMKHHTNKAKAENDK